MRLNILTCLLLTCTICRYARALRLPSVENSLHSGPSENRKKQYSASYTSGADADRVKSLPGWYKSFGFELFAGYITVDDKAGRALFYIFAESQSSPAESPVMLWLNGGPGCSSIGGGFMSELGPFYPRPDGLTLQQNQHSWNRFANMLFIESPAFVGFSYSNTSADQVVGDKRTTDDLVVFLQRFFRRFPQYHTNDFWVSGESYAGHYVPNLAKGILDANAKAEAQDVINLKGFLAGNPWTDAATDNEGTLDYWWSHAIVSDSTRDGIKKYCNFSDLGPLRATEDGSGAMPLTGNAAKCGELVDTAFAELGDINIYEIYADVCSKSRAKAEARQLAKLLRGHPAGLSTRATLKDVPPGYDACIDGEVEAYLNLPAVQRALHANISGSLPWRWSDCSDRVQYSRQDLLTSMLPVYRELLGTDLKILVYSGDVDGIVAVVGTRRWVAALAEGRETTQAWGPWKSSTGQVGGWMVQWGSYSFATVRNAGHMVPYVQPERAYYLVSNFVGRPPSQHLQPSQ